MLRGLGAPAAAPPERSDGQARNASVWPAGVTGSSSASSDLAVAVDVLRACQVERISGSPPNALRSRIRRSRTKGMAGP